MRRVMVGLRACVDADVVSSVEVVDFGDETQINLLVSVPGNKVGGVMTRAQVVAKLHELGFHELAYAQGQRQVFVP